MAQRVALVAHFVRDAVALALVAVTAALALLALFVAHVVRVARVEFVLLAVSPAFWVLVVAFPVWLLEGARVSLGFLVGPLAGFPEGFLRFLVRFPDFRFRFPFS